MQADYTEVSFEMAAENVWKTMSSPNVCFLKVVVIQRENILFSKYIKMCPMSHELIFGTSSGSKEDTTTLHVLCLLKELMGSFPLGAVKSCCETLLRVMTLSHVVSSPSCSYFGASLDFFFKAMLLLFDSAVRW